VDCTRFLVVAIFLVVATTAVFDLDAGASDLDGWRAPGASFNSILIASAVTAKG
jgi:hypothetical protein